MTTIVLVGVAIFLAVFAIVMKAGRKPKKPDKWEKAQIMKQLLAQSEREDPVLGMPRQPSGSQPPTPRLRAAAASASSSRTTRPA